MWFLSALQFVPGQADDRVAVEALMNTSAIDSDPSQIVYGSAVVQGNHRYDSPPVTPQKRGPHPLGKAVGEKLNYLDSGSDEMQPVWYAGGQLWGILDSRVGVGSTLRGGLLWMTVQPAASMGVVSGTVTHAQFVSVDTQWLDYGAIAVNGAGTKAIIVASWAGKDVYPSSVYGWLDTNTWLVTSLNAYLVGVRPVDDFDCYEAFNPDFARGCRFGDYNGVRHRQAACPVRQLGHRARDRQVLREGTSRIASDANTRTRENEHHHERRPGIVRASVLRPSVADGGGSLIPAVAAPRAHRPHRPS
jgi:hypothetical protein